MGLRWWNEMTEEGESKWQFESLDAEVSPVRKLFTRGFCNPVGRLDDKRKRSVVPFEDCKQAAAATALVAVELFTLF